MLFLNTFVNTPFDVHANKHQEVINTDTVMLSRLQPMGGLDHVLIMCIGGQT